MDKYSSPLYKTYETVIQKISSVNWEKAHAAFNNGRYFDLTDADLEYLRGALAKDYYIILTRRKSHLTTYLISAASMIKTGKFSYWAHSLMNMEGDDPQTDADYRLVEATSPGVHYSTFMEVFDVDSVALLKPKLCSLKEFTFLLDHVLEAQIGKKYDNLFDLADSTHMSCVELVRTALKIIPGYEEKFPHFEAMIKKYGNLTPQMYADCNDFEIVWEARR